MPTKARDRVAVAAGLLAPPAVSAMLVPVRSAFANTNAALVLVLIVVAVAAMGNRWAGILAALSSGVSFDFFLTQPYARLTISQTADIETLVLLLLVGVGVSELAVWGRGHQAAATRDAGYLAGVHASAEAAVSGGSASALIDQVSLQLQDVLGLVRCRFDYGSGLHHPRLEHDGRLVRDRQVWDVDRRALPTDVEIELLVQTGNHYRGRFLLSAAPDSRPTLEQRRLASALSDQVGAALAERSGERR